MQLVTVIRQQVVAVVDVPAAPGHTGQSCAEYPVDVLMKFH